MKRESEQRDTLASEYMGSSCLSVRVREKQENKDGKTNSKRRQRDHHFFTFSSDCLHRLYARLKGALCDALRASLPYWVPVTRVSLHALTASRAARMVHE